MTLEEVIVSELAGTAPAHALVIPPDGVLPCVVYQLISGPESQMNSYTSPWVQLACWATRYGAAVALANQVRSLFYHRHVTVGGLHYRSVVENTVDGNSDLEAGRYSRIVDVRFDYRNPA